MRPSPALVLAAVLALAAAQLTRLLFPGRGPYALTLALSAGGVVAGELLAGFGHLAGPAVGALHPILDAVAIAVLEAIGVFVIAPAPPPGEVG